MSRRVLVTGAASGLGAALVRAFEAAGDDVLLTDISYDRVVASYADSAGEDGGRVVASSRLHLDVTSDDDWADAFAWVEREWGGLDVLVNNAGVAGGGRLDRVTMDEWEWITRINLFGVVRGTRTFVPMFKAQRSGHIVNTASLAGLIHPAGMASYNAVKAAVVAFTETCGHELAEYGVRASVVCPSYFRTNLLAAMRSSDQAVASIITGLVNKATLTADDVAVEVLAGIERGDELIVPDEPARRAVALKRDDRPAYDALMRHQAASLDREA